MTIYQHRGKDMHLETSHVPPAQSSKYVTKDDLIKFLEAKKECMADIDFNPPYL